MTCIDYPTLLSFRVVACAFEVVLIVPGTKNVCLIIRGVAYGLPLLSQLLIRFLVEMCDVLLSLYYFALRN